MENQLFFRHLMTLDSQQRAISNATTQSSKSELGQFFTRSTIARFMVRLCREPNKACHLLDAGAGIGALSCAFLDEYASRHITSVTAVEFDSKLIAALHENLTSYSLFGCEIVNADYIEYSVTSKSHLDRRFTHAVLNPPYKKFASNSKTRSLLREVGIETVNLYSAFVSLAINQLQPGGSLVAIIPRSFCNGPYYKHFRKHILNNASIDHIHLFDSRNTAFKDDGVLQENVIIALTIGSPQGDVVITRSTDDQFDDLTTNTVHFGEIVRVDDDAMTIHIPVRMGSLPQPSFPIEWKSLTDLGISVSTGPAVDFRIKDELQMNTVDGAVPLLYPHHFKGGDLLWPSAISKKPNSINVNDKTRKLLFPIGHYCVVRRFSSKEEDRRINASVVDPNRIPTAASIVFENHLNVFHTNKAGLDKNVAAGLAAYLNSTQVDSMFRQFNGHTQVNATDLKYIKYPPISVLISLGAFWDVHQIKSQKMLDDELNKYWL